ncbi:MAG TPA: SLC13 family permease [Gaiellales bacterium]|nr:SLC13 family permease [Gaiellales bacterium]
MTASLEGALHQTWPPFVLVLGLLLIGLLVERDGLFEAVAARIERVGGPAVVLLAGLLLLEAAVTAVLNLDTAAVFMTPVLIHAARHRGCDRRAFVYGALLMANGASLLLPGSNLTNLIVLAHEQGTGRDLAGAMLPAWLFTLVATIVVLAVWYRPSDGRPPAAALPALRLRTGALATAAATMLMLALAKPALPVLGVGVIAVAAERLRPRVPVAVPALLFVVAVSLGTLAREWSGPADLLAGLGPAGTAVAGALGAVFVNNLPAAALLSARPPGHPLSLLLGLDIGPNLAVTGSLSSYLWYQACRSAGERPSLVRVSVLGFVLVPLTLAGSLLALWATGASGL